MKSFPYVKISWNEDYPRIFLTRRKKKDGGKYFGPYPNVQVIKKLLRSLQKNPLFSLRPCRYEFEKEKVEQGLEKAKPVLYKKVKSCIYLHTEQCSAPCVKKISQADYASIAQRCQQYFTGESSELTIQLQTDMQQASEKLDYERAAELRDQLQALSHITEKVSGKVTFKKIQENLILEQTQTSRGLTQLQQALNLPKPPLKIECFDISNIQGTTPVASMVCFERGVPHKTQYRKFKIKTVEGPNDFAMMSEVITRRYKRLAQEKKLFPDLVLVDGGKGQLSSTVSAIKKLRKEGYALPKLSLAGIAKRNEELFLPGKSDPIVLEKDAPGLHIVQHIRDEAHRFAITFHRQSRNKKVLK